MRSHLLPLLLPILFFSLSLPLASSLHAEDDVAALKAEMARMCERLGEMQARLAEHEKAPATVENRQPRERDETPPPQPKVVSACAADRIQVYGFMRLDGAYDDSRQVMSHTPLYVRDETGIADDSQFALFPRHSRIGFKMDGRKTEDHQSRAQLEFDFYGGGTEEKAVPMLRHAFVEMFWPKKDFKLLAGQTWELASPRIPATVTYAAGYSIGNLAYRKPQLRLTQGFDKGDSRWEFAVAAQQTVGPSIDALGVDMGTSAGRPTWVGHVAFKRKLDRGRVFEFGVSGISGREEFRADSTRLYDLDVRATALDFSYRFNPRLCISGEAFRGSNVDGIGFAGIIQGFSVLYDIAGVPTRTINASSGTGSFLGVDPVDSHGGWLDLVYTPNATYKFAAGFGKDDPDDSYLPVGARGHNQFGFVNASRKLDAVTTLALEYMHMKTDYVGGGSGNADRYQMALIMSF